MCVSLMLGTIMRLVIILLFSVLVPFHGISQEVKTSPDSTIVMGKLICSESKKPLSGFFVSLIYKYNSELHGLTDSLGLFTFTIPKEQSYSLIVVHPNYVEKTIFVNSSEKKIQLLKVRPRANASTVSDIDTNLIGKSVKQLLKANKMEFDDMHVIFEPPGICRGLQFELGDSTTVNVFINRAVYFNHLPAKKILKQKITGFTLAPVNGQVEYFGSGRPPVNNVENRYNQ
jgi:hypothetical protein